jgi:hypothetical protein
MYDTYRDGLWGAYGFKDAYNPTREWFATDFLGIDQGPIVLMIENHRTEAVWDTFMRNEDVRRGLERAGFVDVNVAVEPGAEGPGAAVLHGSYPNPFSGSTTISFTLDAPGGVTLAVYDLLGRRVATLADGVRPAGRHALAFDATGVPGGVYFFTLRTEQAVRSGRMVVVR